MTTPVLPRVNPITIDDPNDPDALGVPAEVGYVPPPVTTYETAPAPDLPLAVPPSPEDLTLQVLFAIHTDLTTLLERTTAPDAQTAQTLAIALDSLVEVLGGLQALTAEVHRPRTYEGQIKLFGQFIKIRMKEVPDAPSVDSAL